MLTIDEFKTIMRQVAGNDPDIDSAAETEDSLLADLGYDSLALLEIAAVVQQRCGISVPDDSTERMTTPRAAVAYINELQAAAAGR
jgi:act minimal PKS acyl carrier protein